MRQHVIRLTCFLYLASIVGDAVAVCPIFQYGWTDTFGGTGDDVPFGGVADSTGKLWIVGRFQSTVDFDPTAGIDNRTSAGGYDTFLTTINADGTYGWTHTIGGGGTEAPLDLALDSNGNAFFTGNFQFTVDFDPTAGVDEHTAQGSPGNSDVYVTRINNDGSYGWTGVFLGTTGEGSGITVDLLGNVIVTGTFKETADFDPTAGEDFKTSNINSDDVFVTKLGSDGSYGWTQVFGGTAHEEGHSVATDSLGNVFASGAYRGTVDFDPTAGTDNRSSAGERDAFVTKYGSDGTYLWTRTFGSSGKEQALGVSVDSFDNVIVTGMFAGTVDFDSAGSGEIHTSNGSADIFVTKFDPDGNHVWTRTMGGTGTDTGLRVIANSDSDLLVSGGFGGDGAPVGYLIDFDPTEGVDSKSGNGDWDAFVTKLNADGSYQWTVTLGGPGRDTGLDGRFDADGNILITGSYQQTADFDPSSNIDNHTSNGVKDVFVTKLVPVPQTSSDNDGDGIPNVSDNCPCYYNPTQEYNKADLDKDCDVDGNDFLTFSNCFNGALNPPACP